MVIEQIKYSDTETKDEEKKDKLKQALRRFYLVVIAFFLIFLTVSYVAGPHVLSLMAGKIVSSTINSNNTIAFRNIKIIFEEGSYDYLTQIYQASQSSEFAACLFGEKINSTYYIKTISLPSVIKSNVYSVTFVPCPKEALIGLHSHPFMHCIFSDQDMSTYSKMKQQNKDVIMALMCDTNRFSFYYYD